MKKADWGQGKNRFFDWEKQIAQLMHDGESYDGIFEALKPKGMNVTRRTFMRYAPEIKADLSNFLSLSK